MNITDIFFFIWLSCLCIIKIIIIWPPLHDYFNWKQIAKDLDLYYFEFDFFDKYYNKLDNEKVYKMHQDYLDKIEKEEQRKSDEAQKKRLISKF